MTRGRTLVIANFALLLASPALAEADPVREAVEAANRTFEQAFARGDAAALAGLYTEDAHVVPPGAPLAQGRAAIERFWQDTIDAGAKSATLQTTGVESAGDLAYETGLARLVAADGSETRARYVVVWKRVGDRWKLHRDIWNSES